MSYTFTTKLLGPKAEIEGTFTEEEPQTHIDPGCSTEFEIESIKIDEKYLYIHLLNDETLSKIEKQAFENIADDCNSHEPD